MPIVTPFKGLRYDPRRIGSLSQVVTPPYDVISPEGQRKFYRRHPNNFIRVVYGKESRLPGQDRYSKANKSLKQWIRSGILITDREASVYPYEQEYRVHGKVHRRLGVIGLVRLDSRIYPHEEIREGPKLDRLKLMKAVNGSLDPIFGLVPDARGGYRRFVERVCRKAKPAASFEFEGVRHRLWRITDPGWIRSLSRLLRSKELVIADGHHRFAAACAYREERKKEDPKAGPGAPYNFVMFYLSAAGADEPGLLPTHRIVRAHPFGRLKQKLEQAKREGTAEPVGSRRELVRKLGRLRSKEKIGVGLYTGNGAGYLLRPETGDRFELDVEWLHGSVLPRWLGKPPVEYTQDLEGAWKKVRGGAGRAVFVMQPPRLKDVLARARAFRKMPRKTTYFYPKLVSGLVEYPFWS